MILTAIMTALLVGSFALPSAFAVNPYNAGYISGSPSSKTGFNQKVDFSNIGSGRTYNLASVHSAAGFTSSSATDPTG